MKRTMWIVGVFFALACTSVAFAAGVGPADVFHAMSLTPGDVAAGLMLANAPLVLPPEELKRLEEALSKKASEVVEQVQKLLTDEVKKFETLTSKGNDKLTEVVTDAKSATDAVAAFKAELQEVQQKLASKHGGGQSDEAKSAGQLFVESAQFKAMNPLTAKHVEGVPVGFLHKTAIVNASGQNQPLVADERLPFLQPIQRRLTIRDLLMPLRTSSNLVQLPAENVFTNSAAVQFGSPDSKENTIKAESGITFTLTNKPIETIAHWIPVSRQVLADAPFLQSYIDQRLTYGLKLTEEAQFLNGDGTGGNLSGLLAGDTAYNRGVSNDTRLDCLLKAILQVALSDIAATGMILNPADWYGIRLLKDTTGRYLIGQPQDAADPRLWGLPVVATNSMTEGQFQVGAYNMAAAVIDREDVTVRMTETHDDFFVKNMVVILCEERCALFVFRATSIVGGTLPALGT